MQSRFKETGFMKKKTGRRCAALALMGCLALQGMGMAGFAAGAESSPWFGVSALAANAEAATSDGVISMQLRYQLNNDGTAEITGIGGIPKELEIPAKIDGIKVTSIAPCAFQNQEELASVSIAKGVQKIGSGAFMNCVELASIDLPDSVTEIGANAFAGTAYAANETNWFGDVLYIGNHLVMAAESVSGTVEVQDGTVSIAASAFGECAGVKGVKLPASVKGIGGDAFKGTGWYKNSKNWNGDLLYLGTFLVGVKANKSGKYKIKSGTKVVAANAFEGLKVKSVTFPKTVTTIEDLAFGYCKKLVSITLPSGLKKLDNSAFFDCTALKSVTIPKNVSDLGRGVFESCTALEKISVHAKNKYYTAVKGNLYTKDKKRLIQYAIGSKAKSFSIPKTVKVIGAYSVKEAGNLTSVTIPKGVQDIGDCAFDSCKKLKAVSLPGGVKTLGQCAFYDNKALKKITLPASLSSIGQKAFEKSGYYNNAGNWKQGVLYIGKHLIAADGETVSGAYQIKEGTRTLAEGAFRACVKLTAVTLPESLTEISAYAFYNCQGLEEVRIPETVTRVGDGAFTNCISLKQVSVPKTVREIGVQAFGFYYDYEQYGYVVQDGFTIAGDPGTAAQQYAKENFIVFRSSGEPAETAEKDGENGEDGKSGIVAFKNGMAQPVVEYSDPTEKRYRNEASEILRFAVYVETDYDTDLDGKADLVKALVQVPRAAVEGKYKAPVIFEANPYSAGQTSGYFPRGENKLSDADLRAQPQKREAKGSISCADLAQGARVSDWCYSFEGDPYRLSYYSNLQDYDYFLLRGFAFVTSAGLGSKGSEGLQVCGTGQEREAFKDVVEWLCGKRTAYADLESNVSVSADWTNQKVGMVGLSYVGAMAYEVATTGVEGLETVVPIAGPSSWYDFSNSQGICTSTDYKYDYTTTLSNTCASRFFEYVDETAYQHYLDYTNYIAAAQEELQGDYGDYWAERDYSKADGIKASALIVQGLNDDRVRPKQFDLMWKAFERSGVAPKAILHQNEHICPYNAQEGTDIKIGEDTFAEVLNRWFSHYLFGVENGAEQMPALTVQSNLDGSFHTYDKWDADQKLTLAPQEKTGETNVTSVGAYEDNESLLEEVFTGASSANAALWKAEVKKDQNLQGAGVVKLRVKCDKIDSNTTSLAAVLVDTADTEFPVFTKGYAGIENKEMGTLDYGKGLDPVKLVQWMPTQAKKKIVSYGVMDLKNPDAGYMPETAVKSRTAVQSNTWNDYTVYLQPTFYTLKQGHRLELYIVPYVNGSYMQDVADVFPEEEIASRFRCTLDGLCRHTRDYRFTIDNSHSTAELPVGAAKQEAGL